MALKKTDILQAHLAPGFSEKLEASSLRIAEHGYFAYTAKRWTAEEGDSEASWDGKLSKEDLSQIKSLIGRLNFDFTPPFIIEDTGCREVNYRLGGKERTLNIPGGIGRKHFPQKRVFNEVWKQIHALTQKQKRAEQGVVGNGDQRP